MQNFEQSRGELIIRQGFSRLKDRLVRNEPVEQIIGSVLETDLQILYPLLFANYSGDPTKDLPKELTALYEIEPQAIARNYDFVQGFEVAVEWWNDFLVELSEAKRPLDESKKLVVKRKQRASSKVEDELIELFEEDRQKRNERIKWLRDNLGTRFLGAEYLVKRWEEEVSVRSYPSNPDAVRAVIRGVNKLCRQITGKIPPEVNDISEPVPEEIPPFVYTFKPAELGGVAEAELLDTFFQSIERGDTKVSLPEILKAKLLKGRSEAQTLTPSVPEKGFRVLKREQRWYTDSEYLVGSRAAHIDFLEFPIPAEYINRAEVHLHPFRTNKDGSEGSHYLSPNDITAAVVEAEKRPPVIQGAIGKDILVIAVATEKTRQRVMQTFPRSGWKHLAEIIYGHADQMLIYFHNRLDVQTFEEAKKIMNQFCANNMGLNLYVWDYKADSLLRMLDKSNLFPGNLKILRE